VNCDRAGKQPGLVTLPRQRNAQPTPDDLREVHAFFRVVKETEAKWALMENVPGSPVFFELQ